MEFTTNEIVLASICGAFLLLDIILAVSYHKASKRADNFEYELSAAVRRVSSMVNKVNHSEKEAEKYKEEAYQLNKGKDELARATASQPQLCSKCGRLHKAWDQIMKQGKMPGYTQCDEHYDTRRTTKRTSNYVLGRRSKRKGRSER